MRFHEDDYEIEAIEKCSRALFRLEDRAKIRVVKYLLEKFGLVAQTANPPSEIVNNIIHNQNNLVLTEPNPSGSVNSNRNNNSAPLKVTSLKEVLIKELTKSEPEFMLIIAYYNSDLGRNTFSKQSIVDSFREHNLYSVNRRKNFLQNFNSLIKKSYLTIIADDEFSITQAGLEIASDILNGNSPTKKRKTQIKKNKSTKSLTDEEEVINSTETITNE